MKISGNVTAIIITVIVTIGMLFGIGRFDGQPTPTYATVNFDGGWKKLGVIAMEQVYTEVAILDVDGEELFSGDFEGAIVFMRAGMSDEELRSISWMPGTVIDADAGIEWLGSESNFKLATETFNLTSTEDAPVLVLPLIDKLRKLEQAAKEGREAYSAQSLTFSDNPNASFIMNKMLKAVADLM